MDTIDSGVLRDDMERLHAVSREVLLQAARTAVAVAEQALHVRAERARRAAVDDRAAWESERDHLRAYRDAAAAVYETRLRDPRWFADAPIPELMDTWATADAWAQAGDSRAVAARERFRLQVQQLGLDPDLVQTAVDDRDVQALTDLLDAPAQDPTEPTSPTQATGDRPQDGRGHSGPEPTFSLTVFEHEALNSRTLTKREALTSIERAPGPASPELAREYFRDYQNWVGKDAEVDAALSAKWPDHFPAPAMTQPGPARPASRGSDHEGRSSTARQPTRRQQAAALGRDGTTGQDIEEMTAMVRQTLHPEVVEMVLGDKNWPRVAGQLHRAKSKIEKFNQLHPDRPLDLRELMLGLQHTQPRGELRTPAGWLIWKLHNASAARGVQLIAQTHPHGPAARTGRGKTSPTAAQTRGRQRQAQRSDAERE